ncbi:MAG: DUF309 domain-containing protein [Vicinamibacterales bacterium]
MSKEHHEDACGEKPPALLVEGIGEFNRGLFFEQHETLEELWRAERRPVRDLYRGILQVGVAFLHIRRLNYHGATYMLARAPIYLRRFGSVCQSVDVAGLIEDAERALEAVRALGPERLHEFDWALAPQVKLVGQNQSRTER